jgi:hypothetical protein
MAKTSVPQSAGRDIVIGANAKIWKAASKDARVAHRFQHVLSHRDLSGFEFDQGDRVWVFSYSRRPQENLAMLSTLERAKVAQIIYLASASTIVTDVTSCYEYPRVKKMAQDLVRKLGNGKILTIGLVHEENADLPSGVNAATSQAMLNDFLANPQWPDGLVEKRLFKMVEQPFKSSLEHAMFKFYSMVQKSLGSRPCLLRPIDLVLRLAGFRWYGYFALSNRLWCMTTL